MTKPRSPSGKPPFVRKRGPRPPGRGMAEKIAAKAQVRHPDPLTDTKDDGDIGMNARLAALDLVDAALEKRSGFDEAVTRGDFLSLSESERGFARALALLVLRRLGQLDDIIARRTQKAPPEAVHALLRIGLAQVGFMGVPDFAAVSTTVKLAERRSDTRPFKGLINAILRGVIRDTEAGRDGFRINDPSCLAPDWLFQRWKAAYGATGANAIALILTEEPATDLSFKSEADLERLAPALQGAPNGGLSLRSGLRGNIAEWAGYEQGVWWVQDAAAMVGVALLGDLSGKTALDMCSAPGGKTLQMANRGASVVALDRSKNRLKRVEENLTRTGSAAEMHVADAEGFDDPRTFDIVLLDAPCSSTGTLRRQPDVLWATRPADIAKLADVQHRLLDQAAAKTKPGGSLIYCTCSLEREEGETQVVAFLRRHPDFAIKTPEPVTMQTLGIAAESLKPEGWLRLLPHQRQGGQDGFFVAHLIRQAG